MINQIKNKSNKQMKLINQMENNKIMRDKVIKKLYHHGN